MNWLEVLQHTILVAAGFVAGSYLHKFRTPKGTRRK